MKDPVYDDRPRWRFLDTGTRSAAENMALDQAILTARSESVVPDTIRILRFDPPAVLVGFEQCVEQEVRTDFCKDNDIQINRRITGGGAIYVESCQIGWEVIASRKNPLFPKNQERLYATICNAVVEGLRPLGINARFRPRNDIEVGSRKISGTGGVEEGDAFLFQGTLLLDLDIDTMLRSLRIPVEKLRRSEVATARERVTTVKDILGRVPDHPRVVEALVSGFERGFGMRLEKGTLTPREDQLLAENLEAMSGSQWVDQVKLPPEGPMVLRAGYKAEGGVVRLALQVSHDGRFVRDAFMTGDFLPSNKKTARNIEAALRERPLDAGQLGAALDDLFPDGESDLLGVSVGNLKRVVGEIVHRYRLRDMGFSPDEANHVFTVMEPTLDVLKKDKLALMLPYCAKDMECGLRHQEGCTLCGKCEIGDMWKMGEERGLQPITIQSFEHLMEHLDHIRGEGFDGFIGCCCETFYIKHAREMEEAGVPGILVDVDDRTCYDLGKQEDAYVGIYENQTRMNTQLLAKMIQMARPLTTGPATGPTTGPTTEPATEPATGPATGPTTGSSTGSSTEPGNGE